MSIERARAYLKKFGIEERILEFDVSSATVDLAAQALACEPAIVSPGRRRWKNRQQKI